MLSQATNWTTNSCSLTAIRWTKWKEGTSRVSSEANIDGASHTEQFEIVYFLFSTNFEWNGELSFCLFCASKWLPVCDVRAWPNTRIHTVAAPHNERIVYFIFYIFMSVRVFRYSNNDRPKKKQIKCDNVHDPSRSTECVHGKRFTNTSNVVSIASYTLTVWVWVNESGIS